MAFAKRSVGFFAAGALLLSACGSSTSSDGSGETDEAAAATPVQLPLTIDNEGGSMEGHGPRGFAGMGTGLFAGDELNSNFPPGDGIQIWLTFDLPDGTPLPSAVTLRSDMMSPRGDPFDSLGNLQVEPVSYDSFGADVFDLEAIGPLTDCSRVGDTGLRCDVTHATTVALESGAERVQLRLKFEQLSDGDGESDLARFFTDDPNENESGLFRLELS